MTLRRAISITLLALSVLVVARTASADPGAPGLLRGVTFEPAAPKPDDRTAVSGGFSMVHFYGGNYIGAYGTFAQRITTGDHPVAVVGQIAFRHNGEFEESPLSFMGGAQATIKHDENLCVSGRGLIGITHWGGEGASNDLTFQITGVVDIHVKQMNGLSVEVEAGLLVNHASGNTGKGLVINAGVMKTFGGQ